MESDFGHNFWHLCISLSKTPEELFSIPMSHLLFLMEGFRKTNKSEGSSDTQTRSGLPKMDASDPKSIEILERYFSVIDKNQTNNNTRH